jgi:hypothetical protein
VAGTIHRWGPAFSLKGRGEFFRNARGCQDFLRRRESNAFISFCSVRIQASPCRISLSSFSRFPAFIVPAWRRNEVEFGRFIVFEGESCDRAYMNRRVTNEWIP